MLNKQDWTVRPNGNVVVICPGCSKKVEASYIEYGQDHLEFRIECVNCGAVWSADEETVEVYDESEDGGEYART